MRNLALLIAAGAGYGLLLYAVNFALIAPAFYPIFTRLNQPFEIFIHVVYGVITALVVFFGAVRTNGRARAR